MPTKNVLCTWVGFFQKSNDKLGSLAKTICTQNLAHIHQQVLQRLGQKGFLKNIPTRDTPKPKRLKNIFESFDTYAKSDINFLKARKFSVSKYLRAVMYFLLKTFPCLLPLFIFLSFLVLPHSLFIQDLVWGFTRICHSSFFLSCLQSSSLVRDSYLYFFLTTSRRPMVIPFFAICG